MKILKIKRNKIYFENGLELSVGKTTMLLFELSEGKEISDSEYKELIFEVAKNRAFYLLARTSKGKEELKRNLIRKFQNPDVIDKVIEMLEENRYLDDYDYIKNFVFSKKYGKSRVLYELGMKGISRELIKDFYENENIDEKVFIEKYIPKIKGKSLEKAYSFFSRRGFVFEDIKDVFRSHKIGDDDDYS